LKIQPPAKDEWFIYPSDENIEPFSKEEQEKYLLTISHYHCVWDISITEDGGPAHGGEIYDFPLFRSKQRDENGNKIEEKDLIKVPCCEKHLREHIAIMTLAKAPNNTEKSKILDFSAEEWLNKAFILSLQGISLDANEI